jgi:two-component system phosphate regulon sensor histidine kinase PhoR
MVHDLKTPLAVIQGYAQTLLTSDVADDPALRREMLQGILEQSDRLLEEVRGLLLASEVGAAPRRERFDLAGVLRSVVVAERHTARARRHRIVLEGATLSVGVAADPRQIRRVLENLVGNAVKYSPGEDRVVWVRLGVEDGHACVSVTDEGLGMTAEQLHRVLTRGGRVVDPALDIEGSGFGLLASRRILEAHGGQLRATSIPRLGSTFEAILPACG